MAAECKWNGHNSNNIRHETRMPFKKKSGYKAELA